MNTSRRQLAIGGLSLSALAALPGAAAADLGGGFSVSGKRGPFMQQVSSRKLGWAPGGSGSLGLSSNALSQGQYQQARLRMPQTEASVAAMLAALGAKFPYAKGSPPRVFIVGVDYYNAYSLPDNSIVVSFGLLDHAGSDDEVAFVLGHEYSHLLLGHFAGQETQTPGDAVSRLGQLFVVGAAMNAAGGSLSAAADAAARNAAATGDFLNFLAGATAEQPHNQKQEDEADALGFDLALAAAYAAEDASATVFDTIQADRVRRSALEDALQAQLKSQLSQAITSTAAQSFLSGGISGSSIRQSIFEGGVRIAIGAAAARNQGAAHRPPADRKKGIAQYSDDAYPAGAPLREEQHAWLTRVRATREYGQAKIAVEAVADCMKARAAGDYATAGARIAAAGTTTYRGAPMVLCEAARLRQDMGDTAGADKIFSQADLSPDQTIDGVIDHARLLYQADKYDRALQLVDASTNRFGGDEKPFLSLQIAIYVKAGRQDDADKAFARCVSYNDPDLKHDCELAAGKKADSEKKSHLPFPSLPHL